jgi:hypothetical protein
MMTTTPPIEPVTHSRDILSAAIADWEAIAEDDYDATADWAMDHAEALMNALSRTTPAPSQHSDAINAIPSHTEATEAAFAVARVAAIEECAKVVESIIGEGQYDTMNTDCYQDTADRIAAAIRALAKEPSMTDAVSRQAVIEALDGIAHPIGGDIALPDAITAINALPSLDSVDALVEARTYVTAPYYPCGNKGFLVAALSAFDKE